MIKKPIYILLLLSGLLMGCFHQVDTVEEVEVEEIEVIDEEVLEEPLEEIIVDEEINDAISTDDSVDAVIIEETPGVIVSDPSIIEFDNWLSDFVLPLETIDLGNNLWKDVYSWNDELIDVMYDADETIEMRRLCVSDIDLGSYGDTYIDDLDKLACSHFIYSGGYIIWGNEKILLGDFALFHLSDNSGKGYSDTISIDFCNDFNVRYRSFDIVYETNYHQCLITQLSTGVGPIYTLVLDMSDEMIDDVCMDLGGNLFQNNDVTCESHSDSVCAEVRGNICYERVVDEGYYNDEYYYSEIERFYAFLEGGYILFTQNKEIGNRMMENL